MPKRRGETNNQYMNRLRAARGLPPMKSREQLFLEVRANQTFAATANNPRVQARLEMAGFLDIFHPELPEDKKRELVREAGR